MVRRTKDYPRVIVALAVAKQVVDSVVGPIGCSVARAGAGPRYGWDGVEAGTERYRHIRPWFGPMRIAAPGRLILPLPAGGVTGHGNSSTYPSVP